MADREVRIQILGDSRDFQKAVDQAAKASEGLSTTMERVGAKMMSVGSKMSLGLTAPLLLAGRAASNAASDLEQSVGAVESVFEGAAGTITAFGETAAESAGLSKREVNEMAAVIGASLTGMGFTVDAAAEQVVTLEKRAADMAATFGGTTQQAIEAMGSALRGERDPIEAYGVSIKEADVQARILALGLDTSTLAAEKQATATATLDLIMTQTAKTQGQFAREADGAAGAQARASAAAENATATMGDGLLPVTTKLAEITGALAEKFGGLSDTWQTVIVVAGILLAAIGPVVTLVGALTSAVGGLSTAMTFLAANPVGLVIVGIVAMTAAFVIAWQRFELFRDVVQSLVLAFVPFGLIIDVVSRNWGRLWGLMSSAIETAWDVIRPILDTMTKALDKVGGAARAVADAVGRVAGVAGSVGGAIGGAIGSIPGFDSGGVVPGPTGSPQLILAHGGETVLPTHRGDVGGDMTITVNAYGADGPAIARALHEQNLRSEILYGRR